MGCSTQLNEMYGEIIGKHKRTIRRLKSALVEVCRQRDGALNRASNWAASAMKEAQELDRMRPVVEAATAHRTEAWSKTAFIDAVRAYQDSETGEAEPVICGETHRYCNDRAQRLAAERDTLQTVAEAACEELQGIGRAIGRETKPTHVTAAEVAQVIAERDRLAERVRELGRCSGMCPVVAVAEARADAAEAERATERACNLANAAELVKADGIIGELKADLARLRAPSIIIRNRHCCKTFDLPHHPHEDNCRAQQQPESQPAADELVGRAVEEWYRERCPYAETYGDLPKECQRLHDMVATVPEPSPSAEVPECCETCVSSRAEWTCADDCSPVTPHEKGCNEYRPSASTTIELRKLGELGGGDDE